MFHALSIGFGRPNLHYYPLGPLAVGGVMPVVQWILHSAFAVVTAPRAFHPRLSPLRSPMHCRRTRLAVVSAVQCLPPLSPSGLRL